MGMKSTFWDFFVLEKSIKIASFLKLLVKKIVKIMHHTYMYETIRDINEKNDDEENA